MQKEGRNSYGFFFLFDIVAYPIRWNLWRKRHFGTATVLGCLRDDRDVAWNNKRAEKEKEGFSSFEFQSNLLAGLPDV